MEGADALMLARVQFGFTIAFHIIFPIFSIGLASYLAVLEALWLRTNRAVFLELFNYWKKIFAIAFGMGVVSGIVMSYQFGTNWSALSFKAGPVMGPVMAYEVLTAFFLEAGFLGIMLFGANRVGKSLHFFATMMVAFGTLLSAFWILSANSWMHTPAGFSINAAGQFVPEDWWAMIFNPSFPYRLVHMTLAAFLTTAFVVGAVGAYHLLQDNRHQASRIMFSMALWMATLVAPLQAIVGDLHGLNTLIYQPAKIAAMEGHFETEAGAPLILFGLPNEAEERMDYKILIPHLGAYILTHDWYGTIRGLKEWPPDERPPVAPVFWAFRIMVGIGFAMIGIGFWGLWLRFRGKLFEARGFQYAVLLMGPSGFIAVIAGWIVTEVGRQPYTVYGLLKTKHSSSPIDAAAVGASLAGFLLVYLIVFGAGTFYLLRLMNKVPPRERSDLPPEEPVRAGGIMPGPVMRKTEGRNEKNKRGSGP